jgi:1-acyl-sn-glycerol-3-phosphate acyltransferase
LPRRSIWLFKIFRKYARRYLRRHFHALRVSCAGTSPDTLLGPLFVVTNHASWWDPLVGLALTELMPRDRSHYAAIDVEGLVQYPFLERLGFFGVELGTPRGGLAFLHTCQAVLSSAESILWLTPQGKLVDPRERPIKLKEGVGHLAYRQSQTKVLPLALEYPFWNDRCPEALARFGEPISITAKHSETPRAWTSKIEGALARTQDQLAEEGRQRDPALFFTAVSGSSGVGGVYDVWRRTKSALCGEPFHPEHRVAKTRAKDASGPVRTQGPAGARGGGQNGPIRRAQST